MTVRELIETLKTCDEKSEVKVEHWNSTVSSIEEVIDYRVPISSIKSVLYSLKKKGFISNYKDKHNNIIKGCYVIK